MENLDSYKQLYIAVIGNVDSSKSTTIGVLTTGKLDDGKGLSRQSVMKHKHEIESGRTSCISHKYTIDHDNKTILNYIDLAGHEEYLRTTINGLTAINPDLAIVCISDKITKITIEHISLAICLNIPLVFLFTKTDIVPLMTTKKLMQDIKTKIQTNSRKLYHVKTENDIDLVIKNNTFIPIIITSNKTGLGLDLVRKLLVKCTPKEKNLPNGFIVEQVYNVIGYGRVLSGITNKQIKKNDVLYLGPDNTGKFHEIKVKTMHDDYRNFVEVLKPGMRGCLSIYNKTLNNIRVGSILTDEIPSNISNKFIAKVKIFHHHTTIKEGYQAFMNCGVIKETITIEKILNLEELKDIDSKVIDSKQFDSKVIESKVIDSKVIHINQKPQANPDMQALRSNQEAYVIIKMNHLYFLEEGQKLIFREGNTRGVGTVHKILISI